MKKKLNKIIFNENTRQISNASFLDLLRYARPVDYALFIGGLTLCIINGMIGPFQAVIFMTLTNTLIKAEANFKNDTFNLEAFADEMLTSVYLYATIGVATFLLGILSMSCLFTLSERQTYEIRKRYLAALLRQEMAWHDKNEPGALTAKMFAGIEQIRNGMGDKIGVFLQATAHLIFGIIIGFYYSWQLTSMLVLIVPMFMLSLFGSSKIQKNMSHHEMEAYGAAGAIANEVIGGIRTVASFNAQYAEVARYKDRLKYAQKMGIRKALVNGFFIGIYWFLIFFSMGLIFWYGTKLVAEGIIKRGTMFAVFWAIMGGTIRIAQALPQLDLIVASKLAAGDIFRIIDMEPEIDCMSPRGLCPLNLQGRIEFSNLHFRYPTRPDVKVLNGISFKVNPGRTIALVGHSGSGKSTIISLLLRFYEAQEGTITVDGIPIRDLNIEWLRNNIGLVSQEPVMFATTVEGNLKLGKENVTEDEMIKACTVANAHDFIMKLPKGYKTLIGAGGVSLSGGQKQRIAIARALVRDPKILLLDEATSALDSESEVIVQNALDQACASRTTITIAHRLSTIRHADQIIVFNMGNIAESGTHEELMKLNGIYQQLVQAQGIEKGDDDFVVSDVLPSTIPLRRGKSNIVKLDDEDIDSKRLSKDMLRRSEYLRRSLTSCSAQMDYVNEEIRDELRDEGAAEASILDIIKFSNKEMGIAAIGLIFTIMRGLSWPTFSIIYGRTFLALSSFDKKIMMEKAMLNAILYFALAVGVAFSVFASAALFGIVGERMTMRLRIAVFTNILRQDSTFFDNELHSVGRLTSHLATDAQNVKAATDHRLAEVIQGIVSLFAAISVGFWFGWNMAVIAIITCAVLIILCSAVSQYLKFRGQKDVKLAGEAATVASETIENIRTIQALSKQRQIYQSFCVLSKEPHKRAIIRGLWQSVNYALVISFVQFNFAVSYRFGLWLLQNSWSEPFVIFQVIEVLNFASISVLAAASFFPEYIRARLSAALMFHLKSRIPSIDNLSEAGIRQSIKGNIQLENVSFAYPLRRQQAAIKNLSFSTTFGQKVALVGPSGCGKSTIISLLERFYDINDGILSIDGRDIRSYNIRHLRSHIALVGQEPILFNITIRDNIAYGCDHASQDEIEAAAKLANIHSFINALPQGYDTIVGSKGSHLSGGQKQRIAIARAIIRKPKILLFDEATSALDSESEKAVQEALELARCGRTCLVIAHRLSTIQDADLIIVMTNGQIIERGNHYQLLARKGLYYRLVEKQKMS